ncbi:MAG: acyl carrier protein [Oscillospiraceae bacterium]|nr:acyl carrier protein [Oscillospiraceae bacterium]
MVFEKLLTLLAEQFSVEQESISMDTTFEELGADSLDIVELTMALEEEFGVEEMSEEDLAKIATVGDLVNYLTAKLDDDG